VDGSARRPLEGEHLLVLADDVWRAPKRTRHKIPTAWARENNRVLWIETPFRSERPRLPTLRAIEPDLFVAPTPARMKTHYARRRPWTALGHPLEAQTYRRSVRRQMTRTALRPDWTVVWQEPRLAFALDALAPAGRIYYASDRYTDPSGRGREEALLKACLDRVNVVFATSEKIAGDLRSLHPEVHVVPHAVDLAWWSESERSEPDDLARIPHPRLVFVGVGTVKFDFELWDAVSTARPDWHLVTVGPFQEAMQREPAYARLAARPNVHLLGERPYEELPGYLAHADVLVCPYRNDPIRTASGLPHKFYEYALTGLPILSTPFTAFEADLPQLTVAPPEAWPRLALEELPRAAAGSVPDGASYAARVAQQRRVLAGLRGPERA